MSVSNLLNRITVSYRCVYQSLPLCRGLNLNPNNLSLEPGRRMKFNPF